MSFGELLLLLLIALVAIGTNRLSATGQLVGKGLRNFQRGLREARDAIGTDDAPRTQRRAGSSRLSD